MASAETPKIVITEPSSMPPPREAKVQKETPASDVIGETVSIPATIHVASSGEFKPSEDVEIPREEPQDVAPEEPQDVAPEEPRDVAPEEEPAEDQNEREADPVVESTEREQSEVIPNFTLRERCLHYFRICTKDIGLKFMLLLLVLSLPLSIAAVYVGIHYMDKCPVAPTVPIMMFVTGLTCISTAICSMVLNVRKIYNVPPRSDALSNLVICGGIMIAMLLIIQTMALTQINPDDEKGDDNYCNKMFDTYVTYFTYICIAIVATAGFYYLLKAVFNGIGEAITRNVSAD